MPLPRGAGFDKALRHPYNAVCMSSSNTISFSVLGGGGEVGANCYRLNLGGVTVLLDCGTHPKKEGGQALPQFSLLEKAPAALLVSHAHVDHCGAMPYLVRLHPAIRTHATPPTARIMDRMLHNSVAVMGTIARERGVSDYPLYEHKDVNFAMRGVQGHEFLEPFVLSTDPPIEVTFYPSGHVLGSASILLRTPGHSVFYTGDICETEQELMGGYTPLHTNVHVDTLITESTHGATDDSGVRPYAEEGAKLGEAVAQVVRNGGAALLPSFALGRTQEMLNIIARLQEEGAIPPVPVFASGLGRAIYELYDRFQPYLKPGAVLRPLEYFGRIGNVWQRDEVKRLLDRPCIIVATSGMMLENTPSALIAQEMVRHTHHGIFFVGYVDQETLGYRLLNAKPGDALQFELGKAPVEVVLENIQRWYFSAHASRSALVEFIDRMKPSNVVHVHGDPEAIDWMRLQGRNNHTCHAPAIGETIEAQI